MWEWGSTGVGECGKCGECGKSDSGAEIEIHLVVSLQWEILDISFIQLTTQFFQPDISLSAC
ncbi:MAG: hypothetical protein QNJ74_23870 [Trichodesmium sp. MO_231.B1]|nr:hypothetical protein [Trichodesmium sp. MO_231.B1]